MLLYCYYSYEGLQPLWRNYSLFKSYLINKMMVHLEFWSGNNEMDALNFVREEDWVVGTLSVKEAEEDVYKKGEVAVNQENEVLVAEFVEVNLGELPNDKIAFEFHYDLHQIHGKQVVCYCDFQKRKECA